VGAAMPQMRLLGPLLPPSVALQARCTASLAASPMTVSPPLQSQILAHQCLGLEGPRVHPRQQGRPELERYSRQRGREGGWGHELARQGVLGRATVATVRRRRGTAGGWGWG